MLKRVISLVICLMLLLGAMTFVHAEGLEAPGNLTVELKAHENGYPYFQLKLTLTESVKNLLDKVVEGQSALFYEVEMKVGNGEWSSAGGSAYDENQAIVVSPEDSGYDGDIDIERNTYYFRARLQYITWEVADEYGNSVSTGESYSPYSKAVSIGIGSYQYKNASAWAVAELDKASEYGFITEKIKDKMNAPITREELCEVIMKLYEKMVGNAEYKDSSAFSDTVNPEIFKAYELGIVNGVGNKKFAPLNLSTRQEFAAMMYRAVKVIKPEADFSIEGVNKFSDESMISSWALTPVKFMNKNGLLVGSGGKADPRGTTTREQAVLVIVRTYDKYLN